MTPFHDIHRLSCAHIENWSHQANLSHVQLGFARNDLSDQGLLSPASDCCRTSWKVKVLVISPRSERTPLAQSLAYEHHQILSAWKRQEFRDQAVLEGTFTTSWLRPGAITEDFHQQVFLLIALAIRERGEFALASYWSCACKAPSRMEGAPLGSEDTALHQLQPALL